jgi:lipopolysaccharide export system protein LptA
MADRPVGMTRLGLDADNFGSGYKNIRRGRRARRVSIPFFLLFLAIPAAHAQTAKSSASALPFGQSGGRGQPIDITANDTLEWHEKDQQFIARGKAAAKQGDVTVNGDTLTADYDKTEKSNMDIYRLTAEGHVTVLANGNVMTGDKAVYDVRAGKAVMTGENLTLKMPDQTITAKNSFTYDSNKNQAQANGAAKVVRANGDTMTADSMSAFFAKDSQGQNKLERMTADGHLVLTNPTERMTGNSGVYTESTQIATVTGNVHIMRGPNTLDGDHAEMNMQTNISKIFSGGPGGGQEQRVHGIFYPGSDKHSAPGQPAPVNANLPVTPGQDPSVTVNLPDSGAPQALPPASAPSGSLAPPAPLTGPAGQ